MKANLNFLAFLFLSILMINCDGKVADVNSNNIDNIGDIKLRYGNNDKLIVEFNKYIKEKFCNEDVLEEILTIEKTDSTNYKDLIKTTIVNYHLIEEVYDSLVNRILSNSDAPEYIRRKPEYQYNIKKLSSSIDENKYTVALGEIACDRLQVILDSIPSEQLVTKSYKIKVKIKGESEICTYYANEWACTDSLTFSRNVIKTHDIPESEYQIIELLESILQVIDIKKEQCELMDVIIQIGKY